MSRASACTGMARRAGLLLAVVLVLTLPNRAQADSSSSPTSSSIDSAPTALLLLQASSAQGSEVSFGPGASRSGGAARGIREYFDAVGVRFVSAPSDSSPSSAGPGAGLPLPNASALELSRRAGASICVLVGIAVEAKGKIRATSLLSHQANLHIRVLDVASGDVVLDTRTSRFGYDQNPGLSSASALAASISALGSSFKSALRRRWHAPAKVSGPTLSLTIVGATGWRPVASVLKQLAASKGLRYMHALQINSSQVRLSIATAMSTASLVASLRRTRISGGAVAVLSSGSAITMTLIMKPPTSSMPNG